MRTGTLALLAVLLAAPVAAQDLEFALINNSSQTIVEMYLAPSEDADWGENILVAPLDPGMVADVIVTDGLTVCEYDMYYISAEGGEAEDSQNICELATYTLSD
jgi:hypothetical protein